MKSSGNGTPKQCVENLLSIIRGENAMERVKGINARLFDKPRDEAVIALKEDARWVIETYEPRVDVENIEISVIEQQDGSFKLTALISNV